MVMFIKRQHKWAKLTIASGATSSDACEAGGYVMFGLVMPAAFTGTVLTFTVSHDGTTYQALYDTSNTAVSLAVVAASRSYDLPAELVSWPYFKIVSGSAEGATRTLYVSQKG